MLQTLRQIQRSLNDSCRALQMNFDGSIHLINP
jgi:hypothetical protein